MGKPSQQRLPKILYSCHEDFWSSIVLLAFLSANTVSEARKRLQNLEVLTSKGRSLLGKEVTLDPPIRGSFNPSLKGTNQSEMKWNDLRPDVYITTPREVMLIENKKKTQRTPGQMEAYEAYLSQRYGESRRVIMYLIPANWWVPADPKNEWVRWIQTGDGGTVRGILLWNETSTSLIFAAAGITDLSNYFELPR